MATKPVVEFKNSILSCNYIFKDGTSAVFINGVYRTDNEEQIAELRYEINKRHLYLSGGEEVSADELDPMSALKGKIIAEFLASQAVADAKAIKKTNNMGGNDGDKFSSSFGALSSEQTIDTLATDGDKPDEEENLTATDGSNIQIKPEPTEQSKLNPPDTQKRLADAPGIITKVPLTPEVAPLSKSTVAPKVTPKIKL